MNKTKSMVKESFEVKILFILLVIYSSIYLWPSNIYAYNIVNDSFIKYIFLSVEVLLYVFIISNTLQSGEVFSIFFLFILALLVIISFLNRTGVSQIFDRELRAMLLFLLPGVLVKKFTLKHYEKFIQIFSIYLLISATAVFLKILMRNPAWEVLPTPGIGVTDYDELTVLGLFRVYANTIALAMFIFILLINDAYLNKKNILFYFLLISSFIIIFFYYSRLIFLIVALIFVIKYLMNKNKTLFVIILTFIVFGFIVVFNETFNVLTIRISSMILEFSEMRGSYMFRIIEFGSAVNSFVSHPFFGVGIGSPYRSFLGLINLTPSYEMAEVGYKMIHNGFLFLLVKGGIVLFSSYLILFTMRIKKLIKNSNIIPSNLLNGFYFYSLYFFLMNLSADYFFQINHVLIYSFFLAYCISHYTKNMRSQNYDIINHNGI